MLTLCFLFLLLGLPSIAWAAKNFTIDDAFGDSRTGERPNYEGEWTQGVAGCTDCFVGPNVSGIACRDTWHIGQVPIADDVQTVDEKLHIEPSMSFGFDGTAIYVYSITTVLPSNMSFSLDNGTDLFFPSIGSPSSTNGTSFLAFSRDDLTPGHHTVRIQLNQHDLAKDPYSCPIMFDFAEYTLEDGDDASTATVTASATGLVASNSASGASSSSNAPLSDKAIAAIGAVVGVVALGFVAFLLVFLLRCNRARHPDPDTSTENLMAESGSGNARSSMLAGRFSVEPYPSTSSNGGDVGSKKTSSSLLSPLSPSTPSSMPMTPSTSSSSATSMSPLLGAIYEEDSNADHVYADGKNVVLSAAPIKGMDTRRYENTVGRARAQSDGEVFRTSTTEEYGYDVNRARRATHDGTGHRQATSGGGDGDDLPPAYQT